MAQKGVAGITSDDQTNAEERRAKGEFVRGVSSARNFVGTDEFPVAADRYHLYVAYNCPWCHRVLLGRAILGLDAVISVDVCFPNRSSDDEPRGGNLWKFQPEGQVGLNGEHAQFARCTQDTVMGKKYVKEIYEACGFEQEKSVPILFDKQSKKIVNNESAEILRMFGTEFLPLATQPVPLYPASSKGEIDELNDYVYTNVANGAYKAGFSSSQEVYKTAYENFFKALDRLEKILESSAFLVGEQVTEADVRLFPTLFRLDPVYHNRFKLNYKFLWAYPNLWRWMGALMRLPGMESCCDAEYLAHCKQGYFGRSGNGTIPVGPPGYPECYLKPVASQG